MIKILATAEYKTEEYFSTARRFILDMFVPAWYPILSHLGTSLSVPVLAVPHLPILLGGPWVWKQGFFLMYHKTSEESGEFSSVSQH